jgi:predicted RND superfamily exporter protein
MLVVLVLLLGNVFQPFAILLSLPLSLGGVVLALLLTRQAFSMPVIIGMLMLIGIVAKNAIMLVDFAVERQKNGMERVEAVIDAGLKRARPIVMTTIAMGAGMFPTALGIGEGSSFRSPMATAVIGGLIVSTFLSLIFVPSYFVIMDDLARLTSWIFGRFLGKKDEPEDVDPAVVDLRDKVAVVSGQVAQVDGEVSEQAGRLRELASQVNEVDSKIEALRRASGGKGNLKLAAE